MTLDDVREMDRVDPLANCAKAFSLPDGVVYLDGNSLGAMPVAVPRRVEGLLRKEWRQSLVRGWTDHSWIDLPVRVGKRIAGLIGANEDEVVVSDSTSVNLHKLLVAALKLREGRSVVVSNQENFPTDLYIVQGLAWLLDDSISLRLVPTADIESAINEEVAVVMLTQVDYRTGAMLDIEALTDLAHQRGALVIWDLSHSAGAIDIDLGRADVDFAVGCGYKYLNGGPGAPAFLFVAKRHQDQAQSSLWGWFGHASPFEFDTGYQPSDGLARMQCGTPPILSLVALDTALDAFMGTEMKAIRAKSVALTDLFVELVDQSCQGFDLDLASPRQSVSRGSQVSLRHDEGYPIVQALIARGVIGDFRAPDILRFGFAPLYLRYENVWTAVETLREVMITRAWDSPEFRRRGVVT
ncbi:MAG: kynureninase [bacterium]|nr:kynureninase [bacterium]